MLNFCIYGKQKLTKGWLERNKAGLYTNGKCTTFTSAVVKDLQKGWLELLREEKEPKLAMLES
jgi:hypothetical protein